jgi:hypothetical protein
MVYMRNSEKSNLTGAVWKKERKGDKSFKEITGCI